MLAPIKVSSPFFTLIYFYCIIIHCFQLQTYCLGDGVGNCLKYLKREWKSKEGKENKDFEKGGQAGSRGGCLKREGWNTLTNYASFSPSSVF